MKNTKDFIIDEAFKLFLTQSYEGVSISKLSNAIGMTKGALYHHFKNKEELFKSVVDKYLIFSEIDADVEAISLFEYIQLSVSHAENIVRSLFKNTVIPFDYMSLFADAFRHYPGYAEKKAEYIDNEIGKIIKIMNSAIESGEIRDDINVSIVATNFFSFSIGLAGSIVRNYPLGNAVEDLKEQYSEYYKLLKKN